MKNTAMRDKIKKVADLTGLDNKIHKWVEESGELTIGLFKEDLPNIKEEIADCRNVLLQLMYLLDIDEKEIEDIAESKLDRTIRRLGNEE